MDNDEVRAQLDKKRAEMQAMFDRVAPRYDLMNNLMAPGAVPLWRQAMLTAVAPKSGEKILDLAAGPGSSSLGLVEAGADVVPCDLSFGMLSEGKRKHPELPFINGDALALPFADNTFDAVTISYGLRNVENTVAALSEMRRVVKPGGRLVVNEFSTPTWAPFRVIYRDWIMAALPRLARLASTNAPAYAYLAESIIAWPDQAALADLLVAAGWNDVSWKNLSGGIVALHRGMN